MRGILSTKIIAQNLSKVVFVELHKRNISVQGHQSVSVAFFHKKHADLSFYTKIGTKTAIFNNEFLPEHRYGI